MASTRRGVIRDIFLSYRSSAARKAGSIIDIVIDAGINELTELVRDHRRDWQMAVQKESRFSRNLKLDNEFSDFYHKSSTNGALDLQDIAFNGFSC